ncbi:MAG: SMC-Scp complex subunit ScpB [Candidatus Omnitrophica bacterium]|nr:SMC-Scp complex subunit ScpB [Candidatus Omnitrophota bacterium]MCM8830902.1 SMC-Scp complex subunit ScpB [Candidatus Omnitrophota bacterium]
MTTKTIIESLLFVNEKPLTVEEISEILDLDKDVIKENIEMLMKEYNERESGICIIKVAGGYQMCSHPDNEIWIKKMYYQRYKQKLSTAALETLAIIAYKQPITRLEIEAIRGVNIDGVIHHLLNLGLIKTAGRKEVVGRPFLYVTTRKFLEYFGLNSLSELPKLEEFLADSNQQLFFQQHNLASTQLTENKNIISQSFNNSDNNNIENKKGVQ